MSYDSILLRLPNDILTVIVNIFLQPPCESKDAHNLAIALSVARGSHQLHIHSACKPLVTNPPLRYVSVKCATHSMQGYDIDTIIHIESVLRNHMAYRSNNSFVHFRSTEMADAAAVVASNMLNKHKRCCGGLGVYLKAYPKLMEIDDVPSKHVPDMRSCTLS